MSENAVREIIERAVDFAKVYVRITEALLAEGVPERIAREEARYVAFMATTMDEGEDGWC